MSFLTKLFGIDKLIDNRVNNEINKIYNKLEKIESELDNTWNKCKSSIDEVVDDVEYLEGRVDTLEDETSDLNDSIDDITDSQYTVVKEEIDNLLHPQVEIASSQIPKYATPGDAGADIQANLNNFKTKFSSKVTIIRTSDLLKLSIEEARLKEDTETVTKLEKEVSDLVEDPIEQVVILPGGHCLIPTGIYTSFPEMYEAQIRPRSGLALKHRITITNSPGTIDANYKNEWGIILDNEGEKPFTIKNGDPIAQVVFALKCQASFVVKGDPSFLSGSDRGGGFGHTTN